MPSFASILAVPELSRLLTGYLEDGVLIAKAVQLSTPSPEQLVQALRVSMRDQTQKYHAEARRLRDISAVLTLEKGADVGEIERLNEASQHFLRQTWRLNAEITDAQNNYADLAVSVHVPADVQRALTRRMDERARRRTAEQRTL